jgi:molybdate transport system substrate-binding protein
MHGLSGIVALVCLLVGLPAQAATLRVHAAISLSEALEEVGAAYTKETGTVVRFNFASSAALAREIELGSPGDLFISADEVTMTRLQGKAWVLADGRTSVLSNSLVVVVPRDSALEIHGAASLASDAVSRLALADPEEVPAGVYARLYLDAAGVWGAVASKVVATEDVRAALRAVERGDVDAGIVYRTDAMTSTLVKVAYETKAGEAPRASYAAAVLSEAVSPDEALHFIDFLSSASARAIFERHGFVAR